MASAVAVLADPVRGRLRFAGAAYALAVLIVGTNLPTPLYPVYRELFHFSSLTITLIVSTYVGVVVPSLLLCGPLADTVGPRAVLVPAFALAALATLLFMAATSTAWLFVARAAQGLAVGAASGPLTAALVAVEPTGNRARASLLATGATTAGAGLGPVLAGGLAQYAPAQRVTCFVVEFALLVPALAAVNALGGRNGAGRWHPRRPRVSAGIRREFAAAGAVSFLAWAVAYIVLALVPSYVQAAMHSHNLLLAGGAAGLLLLAAAFVQAIWSRVAAQRAQATGLVLLTVGLTGLVLAGWLTSIPLLLATLAITGAGQGLAYMGAMRQANRIAPAGEQASVASAFYVVTYLGGGGPVIVVGLLSTRIGLTHAVQAAAVVMAAACLVALPLTRERPALAGARQRSPPCCRWHRQLPRAPWHRAPVKGCVAPVGPRRWATAGRRWAVPTCDWGR